MGTIIGLTENQYKELIEKIKRLEAENKSSKEKEKNIMTTRKELLKKIREVKNKMRETKKTDREEYERLHDERIQLEVEVAELKKAHAIEEDRIAKIKQRKIIDHKKFIFGGYVVKHFGINIDVDILDAKLKIAAGK